MGQERLGEAHKHHRRKVTGDSARLCPKACGQIADQTSMKNTWKSRASPGIRPGEEEPHAIRQLRSGQEEEKGRRRRSAGDGDKPSPPKNLDHRGARRGR
jgi:hypothetical protein